MGGPHLVGKQSASFTRASRMPDAVLNKRTRASACNGPATAKSMKRAPHGFEKSARRSHDDRAPSRTGRAMSIPNRACRPSLR
jgi:hypothetical protein